MRSRLRVAVLECDEPVGRTKEKYERFHRLFQDLLESGISTIVDDGIQGRPDLQISGWDVVAKQEYPEVANIDAILISGSSTQAHPVAQAVHSKGSL
jgi:hypothetical protein